ncbi:unnamed protein product [Mytilus coruscus]|uniref:Uncharacterized protein n=1 Tax=Mytilus coruscus TaxID=42192 RepID=A0A6J8AGH5_MYTCO|nr:unnamed protein product [Mytilus coruscus]
MSDIGDTNHTATNAHDRGESHPPAPSSDIADAFHLFRDYLDYKRVDLKSDLASEQDDLFRKIKEEVGIKFKREGANGLLKIQKKGPSLDSPTSSIVSELITKLKARNKSKRIADSSAGGWTTVRKYEANTIADNSDDKKKIRRAESRAVRRINDLICSLSDALFNFNTLSARRLVQVVEKIINMSPVIGIISRLKTRYSYMCIESRVFWDTVLNMEIPVKVKEELLFWLDNIKRVNVKKLDLYSKSTVMVYSDAMNVACGAYIVD